MHGPRESPLDHCCTFYLVLLSKVMLGQSARATIRRRSADGPGTPLPVRPALDPSAGAKIGRTEFSMNTHGFVRITCASLRTTVADPAANAGRNRPHSGRRGRQRHRAVSGAVLDRVYLRRPVRAIRASGSGPPRPFAQIAQATAGRAQLVLVGAPIPAVNSLLIAPSRSTTEPFEESFPSSTCPITRNSTSSAGSPPRRAPSRPRSTSWACDVPFGIDLLFEAREPRASRAARTCWSGSRSAKTSGCRCLPVGAGDGRGNDPAQPFGQQRDDRQEPLSSRPGGGPVGPCDRCLCDGRRRAIGVNDRRGLRRSLPDCRKWPDARRVAPRRRWASRSAATPMRSPRMSTSPSCSATAEP